jgi:ATP-dependent DNA helicase RecQ
LAQRRAQLLYVAPERLALESTIDLLRTLPLRLFVVDEAHCISQWGHEFRPDYAQLGAVRRRFGAPPTLAVTATAGPRTRDAESASLVARPPRLILRSFARPNLALAFRPRAAGLRQIDDFIARRRGQSEIVYCNSRRKADIMARDLRALGFDALANHTGLDPATRSLHQDAFFARPGVVMVATIAFGMGGRQA